MAEKQRRLLCKCSAFAALLVTVLWRQGSNKQSPAAMYFFKQALARLSDSRYIVFLLKEINC